MAAIVVKTVAVAASRFNKVQHADLQAVENKRQISRVLTGDPMCPRQFSASLQNAIFSTTYVSMRYGQPVEACGTRLNPEAPSSYKIIYSSVTPHDAHGTHYAPERLLYRLSQSRYCDQFILKGTMLVQIIAHAASLLNSPFLRLRIDEQMNSDTALKYRSGFLS